MPIVNIGGIEMELDDATAAQVMGGGASPALSAPASQPTTVTADVSGDPGVIDYITDTASGVVGGAVDSVNETIDFGYDIVNSDTPEAERFQFPTTDPNETGVGRFARTASNFVTGFVGAGKFLKGAKILQGAGKSVQIARGMLQGAMTDGIAMDPYSDRLSNLIQDHPSLRNPVTEYLAANKDDPKMEARFKNALEGLGLGVAVDGVFTGVKYIRKLRGAKSAAEEARILEEASDELEALSTKEAAPEGAAKEVAEEAPEGSAKEGAEAGVTKEAAEEGAVKEEAGAPKEQTTPKPDAPLTSTEVRKMFREAEAEGLDAYEVVTSGSRSMNIQKQCFDDPDILNGVRVVSDALYDHTKLSKGAESHKQLMRDSITDLKDAGFEGVEEWVGRLQSAAKSQDEIRRTVLAARSAMNLIAPEVSRIGALIESGRATAADEMKYVALTSKFQQLVVATKDVGTGMGRDLASLKIPVQYSKIGELSEDFLKQTLDASGISREGLKDHARLIRMAGDNPKAISRVIRIAESPKFMDYLLEYRVNSLLSGFKTQAVNFTSNTLKMVTLPMEKMVGGWWQSDKTLVREGAQAYVGMWKFLGDSLRIARKSWNLEASMLDTSSTVLDPITKQATNSAVITYENIKNSILKSKASSQGVDVNSLQLSGVEETLARAAGYLGTFTRIPSRLLGTSDELFKQLNFRANTYSKLYTEAVEKLGETASGRDIADFIEERMGQMLSPDGRLVANLKTDAVAESGLRYAQEATWTQPLEYGVGKELQSMASKNPTLRLIVPFIRTPVNIMRDFWAHTPGIAQLTKQYKTAIAAGGERAAIAQGKLATGSVLWMTAGMLAANGTLTGSMPKDPKLRDKLLATGWQPYSFKAGNEYIPFNRLDPYSTFFGIAADMGTYFHEVSEVDMENFSSAAVAALTNNITSKSYLVGLSEVLDAAMDPDRNFKKFATNFAVGFLPMSGGMRQARQIDDPHMREVRGIADTLLNALPGFSDDLPAKRNWMNGEPLTYRMIGEDKQDKVFNELYRLADYIEGPPSKSLTVGGQKIEMTGQQYARLCELHGTLKIGGKTMYEKLNKLMSSKRYKLDSAKFDEVPGFDSPRAVQVSKVIRMYREQAKNQLLREDEGLRRQMEMTRRAALLSKAGRSAKAVETLNTLK